MARRGEEFGDQNYRNGKLQRLGALAICRETAELDVHRDLELSESYPRCEFSSRARNLECGPSPASRRRVAASPCQGEAIRSVVHRETLARIQAARAASAIRRANLNDGNDPGGVSICA